MGCGTTSMYDTLGNPFMVEVRDLLTQVEIFQQRWSALSRFERILIVIDSEALIGREIFLRGVLLEHREVFVLLSLFVLFPLSRFISRKFVSLGGKERVRVISQVGEGISHSLI